jgi:hypothetical protein
MPKFSISYRREDAADYAGRLYDRLSAHFGAESVFMDIDTLEPGMDFIEAIECAVSQCDILLVLIGKKWLNVTDAMGQRRLDNLEDFVRSEIQAGLEREIRVIPVLIEGAAMPSARNLPEALTKLARRNALELSDTRWDTNVNKLLGIGEQLSVAAQRRAEAEQRQREESARRERIMRARNGAICGVIVGLVLSIIGVDTKSLEPPGLGTFILTITCGGFSAIAGAVCGANRLAMRVAIGTVIAGPVVGLIIGQLTSKHISDRDVGGILVALWLGWLGGSLIAAIWAEVINSRTRAQEGSRQLEPET